MRGKHRLPEHKPQLSLGHAALNPSAQCFPGALSGLKVEKQDSVAGQGVPEEKQAPTTRAVFEATNT